MNRKRDIILSFIILISLAPALLVIGLLVALESQASPLVGVQRLGKDGKLFTRYLFRTTTAYSLINPTKMGQWLKSNGLDELPTFYNVLQGDMSLTGRPLLK